MSPRTRGPLVSALFPSPDATEATLARLDASGLPRDLVDVVVSERAARIFYATRARPPGRETVGFAGAGGLVGLLLGAGVCLAMLALPGLVELRGSIVIQLLGPNLSTLAGAVVGAVIGAFVPQRIDRRFARVTAAEPGILVAAAARSDEEATLLAELLEDAGGSEVRVEPARAAVPGR